MIRIWGRSEIQNPFQSKLRVALALSVALILPSHSAAVSAYQPDSMKQPKQSTVQTSDLTKCFGEARRLDPGETESTTIATGKTDCYKIKLTRGEFMRLVVTQLGADVALSLYTPKDEPVYTNSDSPNGASGIEPISEAAKQDGEYWLEIRSLTENKRPGKYRIKLEKPRSSTPEDDRFVAAERSFIEGWRTAEERLLAKDPQGFHKGKQLVEKSLSDVKPLNRPELEVPILLVLADWAIGLGDASVATGYSDRAIELSRKANNDIELVAALFNRGTIHHLQGKSKEGDDAFNEGFDLYKRANENQQSVPDRNGLASKLNWAGATSWSIGNMNKALDYYSKALAIVVDAERDREPVPEKPVILHNFATVYTTTGQLEKAIEKFDEALTIERNPITRDLWGEAWSLIDKGLAHSLLGEKEKALQLYGEGLKRAKEFKDEHAEYKTTGMVRDPEGYALHNMGVLYSERGEKQNALRHLKDALILRKAKDPRAEEETLTNLGRVHADLGQTIEAIKAYDDAMTIQRRIHDRRGLSYALNNKAYVLNEQGKRDEAVECLKEALPLARAVGDLTAEASNHFIWARVERARNRLVESLDHIQAGRGIVESQRSSISEQQLRVYYFTTAQQFYDFEISLYVEMYIKDRNVEDARKAFDLQERSRSRGFIESLAEAAIRKTADPQLLNDERELKVQIKVYESLLEKPEGALPRQLVEEARARLEQARLQLKNNRSEILKDPKYHELTEPLTSSKIQASLDADTVLLEYRFTDKSGYLWVVARDEEIKCFDLGSREQIEKAAARVLEDLTAREKKGLSPKDLKSREDDFSAAATALSDIVLKYVASQLSRKKRLLIVADGILQYVPFAALLYPSGSRLADPDEPLVVKHEIIVLPSASTLAKLQTAEKVREVPSKTIALFAYPLPSMNRRLGKTRSAMGSSTTQPRQARGAQSPGKESVTNLSASCRARDGLDWRPLKYAKAEINAIRSLVPDRKQRLEAFDVRANKRTLLSEEMSRYRFVHLIAHGNFESTNPVCSGILLSPFDENGARIEGNGFLTASESYELKLSADIVVLSACESSLGVQVKGEGIVGLTRGFIYAGSPRVLASLWFVNDQSTSLLMKEFYNGMLRKGMGPAAALRAAQVSMFRKKLPGFYWAGFVLQGLP
ncbi:MAG: CHAT domain-containing tetratricopeptide repeat protein [Acidobacteriota bacterium]